MPAQPALVGLLLEVCGNDVLLEMRLLPEPDLADVALKRLLAAVDGGHVAVQGAFGPSSVFALRAWELLVLY